MENGIAGPDLNPPDRISSSSTSASTSTSTLSTPSNSVSQAHPPPFIGHRSMLSTGSVRTLGLKSSVSVNEKEKEKELGGSDCSQSTRHSSSSSRNQSSSSDSRPEPQQQAPSASVEKPNLIADHLNLNHSLSLSDSDSTRSTLLTNSAAEPEPDQDQDQNQNTNQNQEPEHQENQENQEHQEHQEHQEPNPSDDPHSNDSAQNPIPSPVSPLNPSLLAIHHHPSIHPAILQPGSSSPSNHRSPSPSISPSQPSPSQNRTRPILSLSSPHFPKILPSFSHSHSIASIIREKRLQVASRLPSPNQQSIPLPSPTAPSFDNKPADRSARSRGNSRIGGLSDLHCSTKFDSFHSPLTPILARHPPHPSQPTDQAHQAPPSHPLPNPFAPLAQNLLAEVVMTPTTEEWWSLGAANVCPLSRHRPETSPVAEEEAANSDEDQAESDDSGASSSASTDRCLSPKPIASPSSHQLSISTPSARLHLGSSPNSPSPAPGSLASELLHPGGAEPTVAQPTLTSVNGIIHMPPSPAGPDGPPTLSAMSSFSLGSEPVALLSTILDKAPLRCSLVHDGSVRRPADPRAYSALTGQRNLASFVIHGSAGAGAYGFVQHAQEKGPDGEPVGPALMVKYIAKQKILADCWKRHKVLGPIPVEIHVLDHLRRAPSRPSLVEFARTFVGARRARGETGALDRVPRRSALQTICKDGRTGHPHICAILDYFEDPDYYYLVMPRFGAGKDLFAHIEQAPDGLELAEVERIFGQIVDAVLFLHERNIVHRDLKDENVVLDELGNAQLIDFGSAAYVKEGKKFETFSGTLDFAAPEVLRGERHDGKEIDVWALGVMLYVLLVGECPFWDAEEAGQGVGAGSRAGRVLGGRVMAGRASRGAMDLMEQCLCLEPRRRPGVEALCWHEFFVGEGGWSGEWPGWADEAVEEARGE